MARHRLKTTAIEEAVFDTLKDITKAGYKAASRAVRATVEIKSVGRVAKAATSIQASVEVLSALAAKLDAAETDVADGSRNEVHKNLAQLDAAIETLRDQFVF